MSTWTTVPLPEIAEMCLGKMLDKNKNKGTLRPYLANINVRWGALDLEDVREMPFEDRELDRYGLRVGDIVMCEGGEPGRCVLWTGQVPGMMLQKALHRIRPRETVDSRFLFYSLFHKGRTGELEQYFTGATIKHLPGEQLAKVCVTVPPLATQRRIASILVAYDDLIEVNRRRVAVLEEMARGLFEEWFVRFRFPGHESVPLVDTPDGPLPQGWSMVNIADVAETNRASLRPQSAPERVGYIDIASVSPGQIDVVTWMDFSEAPGRARRLVQDGSILWSNVRPNRRSHGVVLAPADGTVASTGFTVLDAHAVPFTYLYQWVTTENFVGYLVGNATGAAYPAVTASTFKRAPVLLPEGVLLGRFNSFAEPLMRQGQVLRQTNERLAASRNILLPRLISGQLSLKAAERDLELAA